MSVNTAVLAADLSSFLLLGGASAGVHCHGINSPFGISQLVVCLDVTGQKDGCSPELSSI
jgi:hypothetical protein